MGRMLGSFDYNSDSERSDLNLCPDCGSYFIQDACPICGKICPEEYRAGNRTPVKHKKRRRNTGSGRVTFVEWYHTWWVIALALIFFPIAGIVLLITSPHKKSLKIGLIVAAVLYSILSTYGFLILGQITSLFDKPVDTSLSREEYIAVCENVNPEAFYRNPVSYEDQYITMTLTVKQKLVDTYENGKYPVYYLCTDENGKFNILIRNCIQDNPQNLLPGDIITVYGEGEGNIELFDDITWQSYPAPCIHVAYLQ